MFSNTTGTDNTATGVGTLSSNIRRKKCNTANELVRSLSILPATARRLLAVLRFKATPAATKTRPWEMVPVQVSRQRTALSVSAPVSPVRT